MPIVATLSTMPVQDTSSAEEIATAIRTLDNYDVEYEVNPLVVSQSPLDFASGSLH